MSHEIESMFYVDWVVPWHGLGVPIHEAPTGADALKLAGLDWEVGLVPLFTAGATGLGQPVEVPGWKAIARETDGRVFGMSRGGAYTPFQNAQAFDFLEAVVAGGDLRYDTAGALFGGKRIWGLARTPEAITIGGGDDKVWPYVLIVNGHDAHTALQALPTTERVVCNNTLNAALGRADAAINVRIYHTGSLMARVAEAQRVLGIASVHFAAFQQMGEALFDRDGLPHIDKLLNHLFPPPIDGKKAAVTAYDFADAQRRMAIKREEGNAWGLLNGITAWVDHRDRRSKDDEDAGSRLMENVLFGSGAAIKAEAANTIMQMTGIYQKIMADREAQMVSVRAKADTAAVAAKL